MHLTFESPEFLKLHYCFQIALAPRKPGRSKPQIILHHRLPVQLPVLSLKKKKKLFKYQEARQHRKSAEIADQWK